LAAGEEAVCQVKSCASVLYAKKRAPAICDRWRLQFLGTPYFLASGQLSETPVAAAPAESLAYV
jgi:hypothetical protein